MHTNSKGRRQKSHKSRMTQMRCSDHISYWPTTSCAWPLNLLPFNNSHVLRSHGDLKSLRQPRCRTCNDCACRSLLIQLGRFYGETCTAPSSQGTGLQRRDRNCAKYYQKLLSLRPCRSCHCVTVAEFELD